MRVLRKQLDSTRERILTLTEVADTLNRYWKESSEKVEELEAEVAALRNELKRVGG